jgi:hypothetical protein
MAYCSYLNLYLAFYLSCVAPLSLAQTAKSSVPFKAVNLGDWLVTEGWMNPSLFDGITNKDLLLEFFSFLQFNLLRFIIFY